MTYDPHKHHRRSIRLKGYDYTQAGAYFVTICVDGGHCLLGEVFDCEMTLNWRGHIVAGTWLWLAERYAHVELDVWQVMPNHLHGIIVLTDAGSIDDACPVGDGGVDRGVGAVREPSLRDKPPLRNEPPPRDEPPLHDKPPLRKKREDNTPRHKPKPLGRLVGAFKTVSTAQINRMQGTEGARFWQRDFYDRIVRNERELEAIQTYIYNNPAAWTDDRLHPDAPDNRFNATWRVRPSE